MAKKQKIYQLARETRQQTTCWRIFGASTQILRHFKRSNARSQQLFFSGVNRGDLVYLHFNSIILILSIFAVLSYPWLPRFATYHFGTGNSGEFGFLDFFFLKKFFFFLNFFQSNLSWIWKSGFSSNLQEKSCKKKQFFHNFNFSLTYFPIFF